MAARDTKVTGQGLTWDIHLADGKHVLEFTHNTLTGVRVARVDGKTIVNTVRALPFMLFVKLAIHPPPTYAVAVLE